MIWKDKLFCGLMVLLALVLMLALSFWHSVRSWPEPWLVKRAWWGDEDAMWEMARRADNEGDGDSFLYWSGLVGGQEERDMLFMLPRDREIMRKLMLAQGKATPLLDVVGD